MGARGPDLAREAADLILTDDAHPTIVTAVAGGRGIAQQLRRAVAFYLGAKIALIAVIAVPLALGLPAPVTPTEIVLLELFMDLGASVAFVSEPVTRDAMSRPPRDPARRFLDAPQLTAIALTAVTLTAAVLPAYLLVHTLAGTQTARAAAIAAWLPAGVAAAGAALATTPIRERTAPNASASSPRSERAPTSLVIRISEGHALAVAPTVRSYSLCRRSHATGIGSAPSSRPRGARSSSWFAALNASRPRA
jgi:Ca2+-transporting ATPase